MSAVLSTVVVGAGQAGLSAGFHLQRLGLRPYVDYVVLDADDAPGGAWQHRWSSLTMDDVHGVAALPDREVPPFSGDQPANVVVPFYFAEYERRFALPVVRPVRVDRVDPTSDGLLAVRADGRTWHTRTLVNATGTWRRPFLPHYPGAESFTGRQIHTHDFRGPDAFAGLHVVVVGEARRRSSSSPTSARSRRRPGSRVVPPSGATPRSPRRRAGLRSPWSRTASVVGCRPRASSASPVSPSGSRSRPLWSAGSTPGTPCSVA